MKKEIKITIPSGLSDREESFEIAKKLNQKLLASHGRQKDKIRIGNEVNLKYGTTTIVVKRDTSNTIEFVPCNVCGCEYQNTEFKPVFTNYGGRAKKLKVCSEDCQNTLLDYCGTGRAAIKKKDLTPIRFY